jgi:hypothetical protein
MLFYIKTIFTSSIFKTSSLLHIFPTIILVLVPALENGFTDFL